MKDYSLSNKIRLLNEIGYFPVNNFCNLTGKNRDLKNLKKRGFEVTEEYGYIFYKREKKDFFRIGAFIQKYNTLIFPIARYYLALEKEGKLNEIDYSFVDYVRLNLKDTYEEYQKQIRNKEIEVQEFRYEKEIKVYKEEVFRDYFLGREISYNKSKEILGLIEKLILKYYPNFDISLKKNDEDVEYIVEKYLANEIYELKFGKFVDYIEYEEKEGYYYTLFQDYDLEDYELIDYGITKEFYDEVVTKNKETLDFINKEIDRIIEENDIKENFVEVEEEIKIAIPIYSDDEVIDFIERNKIWDREFLLKFYDNYNLSEKEIDELLNYYNNQTWKHYKLYDKLNSNYYYYYFDKHLERQGREYNIRNYY